LQAGPQWASAIGGRGLPPPDLTPNGSVQTALAISRTPSSVGAVRRLVMTLDHPRATLTSCFTFGSGH
jgi:hypothetical protein